MAVCKTCHVELIKDYDTGDIVCPNCGGVANDQKIVSDVTFGETSSGKAVVTGQFVGNDQAGVVGSSLYGMQTGESRRQTMEKARMRMDKIGRRLVIPEHIVEGGHRFFRLALTNNFVKGRKSQHVLSACLYLSCRLGETEHMLMDFAEALQVNVFNIGSTYLQLVRNQSIEHMPIVDPTVFVQRFVSKLNFGQEGARRVVSDAKLLVQRMGKDWLQQGRRPAGVAAACVMLAARMNNFRRSKLEVVQVAMIAEETLQRRLDEFKNTPAGTLTVSDFRDTNVDSAADPPAFTRQREIEKLYAEKKAREEELEAQGLDTHDVYLDKELEVLARELDQDDGRTLELTSDVEAVLKIPQLREAYAELEVYDKKRKEQDERIKQSLRAAGAKQGTKIELDEPIEPEDDGEDNDLITAEEERRIEVQVFGAILDDDPEVKVAESESSESPETKEPVTPEAEEEELQEVEEEDPEQKELEETKDDEKEEEVEQKNAEAEVEGRAAENEDEALQQPLGDQSPAASLGPGRAERFLLEFRKKRTARLALEAAQQRDENARTKQQIMYAKALETEDLTEVDDDEIESVILTEEEIEIKTRVWMSINRDYLVALERKRLRAEHDLANGVAKPAKKKRKGGKKAGSSASGGVSAADSAANMVKEKAHSKKINYAALNNLFDKQ